MLCCLFHLLGSDLLIFSNLSRLEVLKLLQLLLTLRDLIIELDLLSYAPFSQLVDLLYICIMISIKLFLLRSQLGIGVAKSFITCEDVVELLELVRVCLLDSFKKLLVLLHSVYLLLNFVSTLK